MDFLKVGLGLDGLGSVPIRYGYIWHSGTTHSLTARVLPPVQWRQKLRISLRILVLVVIQGLLDSFNGDTG